MRNKDFEKALDELKDLHHRKNSNYAGKGDPYANFRESKRLGIEPYMGVLIRMSDKYCRICNLASGIEDKVGESIKDTLTDLAVYSVICRLLIEEYEKKERNN